MLPAESENDLSVSASLSAALTNPIIISSPSVWSHRCVTMKPHAPVTPPGRGQTVACLTLLNSLRPLRKKDPRVGFHLLQPLASDRMHNTQVYLHSFNLLAMIHDNLYLLYMWFCNSHSRTIRFWLAQIHEFHRCTGVVKTFHVITVKEAEHKSSVRYV